MVTSEIGKIFLETYNEKYGTTYNARTFFIEQFYPLFFDNNKYMLYVTNSPFVQGLPSFKDCINGKMDFEKSSEREERFKTFLDKVDNNDGDASIAVGFPSLNIEQATGSQITNLKRVTPKEDIYASWIGYALGIGVGSHTILFYDKRILIDVFEGWKYYRQALDNNHRLNPYQIHTWNGQWINHCYGDKCYDNNDPLSNFDPYTTDGEGLMKIESQSWTKVLISIAKKYEDKCIMGYVCSIGKTNTTLGLIPFDLTGIRRPIHLYNKLFGISDGRNAEALWGTANGFKTACTAGAIGIKAMEPKVPKNEKETINFNVYKIWLLTMLNNEELWEKSQELAELLNAASIDENKPDRTKCSNLVDNVLAATNKKLFIAAANNIISIVTDIDKFKKIVKEIHSMPTDNVPYFLTLVRFQYKTL